MRIISGKLKSRLIKMPKGIRPTQDKVRKALFDILSALIKDSLFLDLFAGSGSVGFEAISRGAKQVFLVESQRNCLKFIKESLSKLTQDEEPNKIQLLPMDALTAIDYLHRQKRIFQIIFLDPPYYRTLPNKTLKKLIAYDILSPNGIVVVQHHKKDLLPQEAGFLRLMRQCRYGDTILTFYIKSEARNTKSETIFQ